MMKELRRSNTEKEVTNRQMHNIGPNNLTNELFQNVDNYIRDNLNTLTCQDLANIYWGFFKNLKSWRGTSSGFTGFSEYLVFRFIYHLTGPYVPKDWTHDTKHFLRNNIRLVQGLKSLSGINLRPDILIELDKRPIAAAEIKTYLVNSVRTVQEVIESLRQFYEINQTGFKALLIIFTCKEYEPGKNLYKKLEALKDENRQWFNLVVLSGSNEPLKSVLEGALSLGRIKP